MQYLTKDSSAKIWVGPIFDTGGQDEKTGLTTDNSSFTYFWGSSSTGGFTADYSWEEAGLGMYLLGLTSDPISVNGKLRIRIYGTGALVRWEDVWIGDCDFSALSTLSTADNIGANVHYVNDQSVTTVLDANIQELAGTTLKSQVSSGYIQAEHTTASYVNLGAVLGSTLASIDEFKNSSSTGDAVVASIGWVGGSSSGIGASGYLQVEVEVVAGTTVSGPLTTASNLNIAAIGGSTVAIGSAQIGVNVVTISSHAITSQSGDNFDIFFDNAGSTTPQTVDDVGVGGSTVEANIVQIGGSSAFLTTAGILNVSMRYIGSSASTVATGTAQLGVNVVEIKDSSFSTRSADNIEAFFYNAGSTTPQEVGDVGLGGTTVEANIVQIGGSSDYISTVGFIKASLVRWVGTTASTAEGTTNIVSTAATLNISAIAGSTIAIGAAQLGVNVVTISSHAITSQSGDNFDAFFDNADSTTPKEVGDVGVGGSTVEANLVQIGGSSAFLTTDGIVNVSLRFVGTSGSTVSAAAAQIGVNAVQIASAASTAANINIGAINGTTATLATGVVQANIVQVVGSTVVGLDDFQNTTSDIVNANVGWIGGSSSGIIGSGILQTNVAWAGGVGGDTVAGTTSFQADITNLSTFDVAETVSISSATTVAANVLYVNTSGITYLSTFSPDDDQVGGMDVREAWKYNQTYAIGDFGVTGASTNVVVYKDYAGTTHFAHTFTTKTRTFSS